MSSFKKKYDARSGRFDPNGLHSKCMNFMVKHPDVVFSTSTLAFSVKEPANTVRTCVYDLAEYHCLKMINNVERVKQHHFLFSVDCMFYARFNDLIPN